MRIRAITAVALGAGLLIAAIALTPKKLVASVVATLIRDQDNAGRHPFLLNCGALGTPATTNTLSCNILTPPGEEAVVESMEFHGEAGTDSVMYFNALTTVAGISGNPVRLILSSPPGAGGNVAATQPTWFAADPNTAVTCTGSVQDSQNANPTNFFLGCTISGYYVTLP